MGSGKRLLVGLIERVLGLAELDKLVEDNARECGTRSIFQVMGQRLGMALKLGGRDMARIPVDGPVIAYANHPTGAMEGVLLPAILDAVRADMKALAHSWFQRWPRMAERMILVDPYAEGEKRAAKTGGLRAAVRWVREGHMLFFFPSAETARRLRRGKEAVDVEWQPGLANLVRLTRATLLPIYVSGRNSWFFYLLSAIHPRLGALLLAREVLRKRGRAFRACVGQPIRFEDLPPHDSAEELTAHLRQAVEDLAPYVPPEGSPAVCLGRVWV